MMRYEPLPRPAYFDRRMAFGAPREFDAAVRAAARRAGLSLADYLRLAAAEKAARLGVECPRLPILSNSEFFR